MAWNVPENREDFGYLELWDAVAAAVPDRECIVQGERRQDFATTRDRSTRFGWWLTNAGFGPRGDTAAWRSPNDLVGILLRNCPEYLETTLACYRARCAPFNINYRYTAAEVAHLLDDTGASVLVYHREFSGVVAEALTLIGGEPPALVAVGADSPGLDGSSGEPIPGTSEYEDVITSAVRPEVEPEPSPDDVHVLYTGGTTGMPKGVMWSLREVAGGATGITVASVAEAAEKAPRRSWLRALPAPPLMHGASLWFAYNAWSRGASLVLDPNTERFDPAAVVGLMHEERVAWLAIVGDAFAGPLLEALDRQDAVPPALSYVFSSGAVLSERSWARLREHYPKLAVINALGSSETGPQAFQTSGGDGEFKPGPNTIVVSTDYQRILSATEPGVGWLSNGGTLPRGYLGDAERTNATFRVVAGRRLAVSGDQASVGDDGEITFLGRASNVINTGGEKVYAEEVERALLASPDVADALVVGRESARWGQEIVALVVGSGETPADEAALRETCGKELARYKIPKAFVWVEAIRRSPNGKPDYPWARSVASGTATQEVRG